MVLSAKPSLQTFGRIQCVCVSGISMQTQLRRNHLGGHWANVWPVGSLCLGGVNSDKRNSCVYMVFIGKIYNGNLVIRRYFRIRNTAHVAVKYNSVCLPCDCAIGTCHGIDDVTTAGYTVPVRCFHVTATSPRGRGLIPKPLPLGGPCPAAGQLAAIRSAPLET